MLSAPFGKSAANAGQPKTNNNRQPGSQYFSGLLKCADCGNNLNFHFNQQNHDIQYFNCSNYNSGCGTCNATHYIRVDFLEQVVWQEIHRLTEFAGTYEDEFVKAIIGYSMTAAKQSKQPNRPN